MYTANDLVAGELYRFKVSSINVVDEGDYSDEATYLCAALPEAPSQPQVVTSTRSEITIQWEAPEDNGGSTILEYEVFYKLQSDPETSWSLV